MPRARSSFTECCVGLVLSSPADGNPRHQREVDIERALAPEIVAELPDRLEERQALDVADRAADLAQHEILAVEIGLDEFLDGIGDVGNDLDGGAEIVASPLAPDHGRIDAPGGDAVAAPRGDAGEALVMPKIEIGLGAVVGDVDLAVLIGAHRAGIDVEVGVELSEAHAKAAKPAAARPAPPPTDPCPRRRPRRR